MARTAHNTSGRVYVPDRQDYGALEQRIYGVEKAQTALGERVDALAAGLDGRIDRLAQAVERNQTALLEKLDRRAAPQWQAIGVFVTVILFVSGGIFTLLSASNNRLERDIATVNSTLLREMAEIDTKLVPRAELEDRREISNQRISRIEADQLRLEDRIFPREVHQERWAAFTAEIEHLREEQDRQRQAMNDISPPASVMQNALERIERLESRWINRTMGQESTDPTVTR